MMELHPTHTCFNDALEYLEILAKEKTPGFFEHRLVHAFVTTQEGPTSHAWVEHGEFVIICGLIQGVRMYCRALKAEYYVEMGVTDPTYYTPYEAWKCNERYCTYGPWKQKYLEACSDYRPGMTVQGEAQT